MPQPRFRELDWYDHPLYYDIGTEAGSSDEADFLEEVLSEHGRSDGFRVLEPACGSGRLVVEMARRGYEVSGFDANERMVEFAAERCAEEGLEVELRQAWMQDFRTRRRFDLAFCLVCTFQHLQEEEDAVGHLRSVARSLRKGGIYVLGFHLADYDDESTSRERWVADRDGVHVVCNLTFWPPRRAARREKARARLKVERGGELEHFESIWEFRSYDPDEVRALLAQVPELELAACYDFHYDLDQPRKLDDDHLDLVLVLRRT